MRALPLTIAVAVLLLLGAADPTPGDPTVAKTLFEGAQKAFRTRKYKEAVSLYQKAWVEDPTLIVALYWKGQAEEKLKDKDGALASYREFLTLLEGKPKSRVTSEERKLKSKARRRVRCLAVAESEFDTLEERYIASLAKIMKSRLEDEEPNAALEAAKRILEVDPDHEEALAVRKKLEPDVDPFASVTEWKHLVKEKSFQGTRVTFQDGLMVLDTRSGGKLRPTPRVRLDGSYACEVEFRVATIYEDSWQAGMSFGDDGTQFFAIIVQADKVELKHGKPGGAPRTLASLALNLAKPEAWHRVGFLVRQGVIECWLDGKAIITAPVPDGLPTDGEIGLIQTGSKVERRLVRAGRVR